MNIKRIEVEEEEEWEKWREQIPELQFKPEWQVRIIPPFAGAMVRFWVAYGGNRASVYLDCYNNLGCCDGPYWEVYPVDGDVGRVSIEDSEGLMALISDSLSQGER